MHTYTHIYSKTPASHANLVVVMAYRKGVWLCCLVLTAIFYSTHSTCRVGDAAEEEEEEEERELIHCVQTISQPCLCLLVAPSSGGNSSSTFFRACPSSVSEIDYSDFNVREIEPGAFRYFTNLLSLNLSSNSPPALNINSQSFTGLKNLTSLDLSNNGLTSLPDCLFSSLSSLELLYLNNNQLTELPSDILLQLPSITTISLESNRWNCSSPNVVVLVELVHSELVLNGDQLRCSNSTLITDIVLPDPPPLSNCSSLENDGSEVGFIDWPETSSGERVERQCPHGPEGGVASRECGDMGEWGSVNGEECVPPSQAVLDLVSISQGIITADYIESIALSFSSTLSSLSSSSFSLSLDEVEVVVDIAERLVSSPATSLSVVNNSLEALDQLITNAGDTTVLTDSGLSNRLRTVIDKALLSLLSTNNTNLLLTFSHLALGGLYINRTNHTHILAVIATIEVAIDGDIEGPIQVTVYNDTGIFNTTGCGVNDGVEGVNDLAPVISVSDESLTEAGSETVTITYHSVDEGREEEGGGVECVKWNNSLKCGRGGWQTDGCLLEDDVTNSNDDIICVCRDSGTYGILDVPKTMVDTITGDGDKADVVEYIFYSSCVLAALLYLPVILAVLLNKSLRVLPLKQCVAVLAISQSLSLLVSAASYHPHRPRQLCYSLAVLQHYTTLVALVWLAVYPIMAGLKVFRRTWFERNWILIPVAVFSWGIPALIVGIVSSLRYNEYPSSPPTICWLESDVFPNYFTYISVLVMVLTVLLTVISLLLLCCSDYDLELPVYLRILSNQLTALLYSITVISISITADSTSHSNRYKLDTTYLLIAPAIMALMTSVYFLLANGCMNGHIRSVLRCQEDPVLKRKVAHYNQGLSQTMDSRSSSRTSQHRNLRRNGKRLADEMNLNYVNSYLGYDEVGPSSSHVPLDVLGQVADGGGAGVRGRVKDKRSMDLIGGHLEFRNVGVSIPYTTSMT